MALYCTFLYLILSEFSGESAGSQLMKGALPHSFP